MVVRRKERRELFFHPESDSYIEARGDEMIAQYERDEQVSCVTAIDAHEERYASIKHESIRSELSGIVLALKRRNVARMEVTMDTLEELVNRAKRVEELENALRQTEGILSRMEELLRSDAW